jgi:hypothetical protein
LNRKERAYVEEAIFCFVPALLHNYADFART